MRCYLVRDSVGASRIAGRWPVNDIGKNNFHLIGLDDAGEIVLRRKLSRRQLAERLVNLPPCLVGMEACIGAHHLSCRLLALGHDARIGDLAINEEGIAGDADLGHVAVSFLPIGENTHMDRLSRSKAGLDVRSSLVACNSSRIACGSSPSNS